MSATENNNLDNFRPYEYMKIVQFILQIQEIIYTLSYSNPIVPSTLGTWNIWLFGWQLLFCLLTILIFIIRRKFSLRVQIVGGAELVILFGFLFLQFLTYYDGITINVSSYQTYLEIILLNIDFAVFQLLSLFLLLNVLLNCPERSVSKTKDDKCEIQTSPSVEVGLKGTNVLSLNFVKLMFINLKLRVFSFRYIFSKCGNDSRLENPEQNQNLDETEEIEMEPLKLLANQEIIEHNKSKSEIYESLETVRKSKWSLKELISMVFKKIFSNWFKKRENMEATKLKVPPPLPKRNKPSYMQAFDPSSLNELEFDAEMVPASFTERTLRILRSVFHRSSFSKFTSLCKTSENVNITEIRTSQNIYSENIDDKPESDLDSSFSSNANLRNVSDALSSSLTTRAVSEDKKMNENMGTEPVSTMHQEIYQLSENEIKVVTTRKTKLDERRWKEEVRESVITLKPRIFKGSKED